MSLFDPKERGKAVGLNASLGALFSISGPLIGGYLTELFSWRYIFWVNLPIAVIAGTLAWLFLPKTPKTHQTFDTPGFFYFTAAATFLITFIMQISDWGIVSGKNLPFFLLFLVGIFLLLRREKTALHPFFDRSIYKHPIFSAANISVFATQFVLTIVVYRVVFFQEVLSWSPIKSGAISMITSIPVLFMPYAGGWLSDRYSPKRPISLGFSLLIFSFFWLAFYRESSTAILLIGLFTMGFGVPLIFTPSYSSAMNVISSKEAGSAFGSLATVRALSNSLGVAIISSIASFVQLRSLTGWMNLQPMSSKLRSIDLEALSKGTLHLQTELPADQLNLISGFIKKAKIQGFFVVHIVMGLGLIIAFFFVIKLYRRKSQHKMPEFPGEGWD